ALQQLPEIADPLPAGIVKDERLARYNEAMRRTDFPESPEDVERARERLKFDELFTLELGVAFRKHRVTKDEIGVAHDTETVLLKRFVEGLPFTLTDGQRRAIDEVTRAMANPHPMHMLLQGDVGSGKTAVALAAAMTAIGSGHQAAIMAPTEVLAAEHGRQAEEPLAGIDGTRYLDGAGTPDPHASLLDDEPAPPPSLTYALLTAAVA